MRWLALTAVIGLIGCDLPAPDGAICAGLSRPVADLRGALTAHPETPDPVGEAGVDVVMGFEAGCGR